MAVIDNPERQALALKVDNRGLANDLPAESVGLMRDPIEPKTGYQTDDPQYVAERLAQPLLLLHSPPDATGLCGQPHFPDVSTCPT